MNREDEKRIVATICRLSQEYDYQNMQDVNRVLKLVGNNQLFSQSGYGKRYIDRLSAVNEGIASDDCVLCGKKAADRVICDNCRHIADRYTQRPQKTTEKQAVDAAVLIEDLFKDMDDSLIQLASQSTVRTIKKLSWINILLSIINSIAIFFLALFLWKFIVSQ